MTFHAIVAAVLVLGMLSGAKTALAQEVPTFDESFWQLEAQKATGKIRRGAGLGVLGLASAVPTAMLIELAAEDPRGYTGWALMASLATVGATLHGFMSVGYGMEQRAASTEFVSQYRSEPTAVRISDERAYFLYTQKKTTGKVILFGGVLVAESIMAFSSGIARSVWDHRGEDAGATEIWPAYLVGGILLPGGIFIIVRNSLKLKKLKELETASIAPIGNVSVLPFFQYNENTRASSFGLAGHWMF